MNKPRLEPCPFCGAKGDELESVGDDVMRVNCMRCGAEGPWSEASSDEGVDQVDDEIVLWNRRTL